MRFLVNIFKLVVALSHRKFWNLEPNQILYQLWNPEPNRSDQPENMCQVTSVPEWLGFGSRSSSGIYETDQLQFGFWFSYGTSN